MSLPSDRVQELRLEVPPEGDGPDSPGRTIPLPPSRWKTRVLVPLAILGASALLLAVTSWDAIFSGTSVRVVPAVLTRGGGSSGTVTVQAAGWLEPDPYPTYVSALTSGVVESVLVLEGEEVAPGQVVARLVRDDAALELEIREAEVSLREAELESAQATLEAARASMESLVDPREAAEVARAEREDAASQLEQLAAVARAEEARLEEAEAVLARTAPLVATGAASRLEVEQAQRRVEAQRATLQAARSERHALEARLRQADSRLAAAEKRLELLIEERRRLAASDAAVSAAGAALRLARARRDEAALRLARTEVRSAAGGVVLRRLVSPGSQVGAGRDAASAEVIHIYDPARLQVRVDVPLADAALVGTGQKAEVVCEALPDRVFRGSVTRVVHQANLEKNTIEVKVALEDTAPELKPDMLARVRFLGRETGSESTSRQQLFVPSSLIERSGTAQAVAWVAVDVIAGRGRAERREVTLGPGRRGDWVEVADGIRPGDLLIAGAPPGLDDGDRIQVTGEAMSSLADGEH